jgi:hypothetical protein
VRMRSLRLEDLDLSLHGVERAKLSLDLCSLQDLRT